MSKVCTRYVRRYPVQTMYTIKQAARLTGVSEASLRSWERRYGVVVPRRNDAGYRVYDEEALAAVLSMRRLVDEGWSPAEAAAAVRGRTAPGTAGGATPREISVGEQRPGADGYTRLFLSSAARL